MPADTQYVLRARLDRQILPGQGGTFGIVNQDTTAQIWVTVSTIGSGAQGDVFYLRKQGETLTLDRSTLRHVIIESKTAAGADQYPATILLVDTDLIVSVTSLASAIAAGGGISGLSGMEYARVHIDVPAGTGQLIPHNTNTNVNLATVDHDPAGYWSNTHPERLTVPAGHGGVPFLVAGACNFKQDQPRPDLSVYTVLNGTQDAQGAVALMIYNPNQAGGFGLGWINAGASPRVLNDGDWVGVGVYQDSSANGNASIHVDGAWAALIRLAR